MSHKGCAACKADALGRCERYEKALAKINRRRASIGWSPFRHWFMRSDRMVATDDAEVCARVFGGKRMWWDREPGYVKNEVKAALRRPSVPKAKREKAWPHRYAALDYSLPLPSLAASSKRLAKAEIVVYSDDPESTDYETFTGPRAAEQYVAYRRAQLGLDLEVAA
jgi:hypothetical protein